MLLDDFKHITTLNLLQNNEISVRIHNFCYKAGLKTLFDIIDYYQQGKSFSDIKNSESFICLKLHNLCNKYIATINDKNDPNSNVLKKQNENRKKEIKQLVETNFINAIENKTITSDDVFNYLTEMQKKVLENKYRKLIKEFSARLRNRLKRIDLSVFITSYLFDKDEKFLKIYGLGKRSIDQIINLKNNMKEKLLQLVNLQEEELSMINKIEKKGDIMLNDFVFNFYKQHKHLPMFWILEQYLLNNNTRRNKIFINTIKIFNNRPVLTSKAFAEQNNLTRERIRQIHKDLFQKTFEMIEATTDDHKNNDSNMYVNIMQNKDEWKYFLKLINSSHCIDKKPVIIQNCLNTEQCDFTIEFALLAIAHIFPDKYSILGGLHKSKRSENWKNLYIVKKGITNIFDFEKIKEDFKNRLHKNKFEYQINIHDYIVNSPYWTVFKAEKVKSITDIVKDILFYEFDLNFDENNINVIIPARPKSKSRYNKKIDIVYEILKANGAPMSLNEIFVEFKKLYPDHYLTKAEPLRYCLRRNKAIAHRNRNSMFTLKEWKHIKAGTIRDTIVEFLSEKDVPQDSKIILEYLKQHFPATNLASVRTTMFNDTKGRFIFFKGNLFGITNKKYPSKYEIGNIKELKKDFDKKLSDMENFIKTNNRFPFPTAKNKDEASLYRWWYKNVNGDRKLTESQEKEIERINEKYMHIFFTKRIYEWMINYDKLKAFMLENKRFPTTSTTEKSLYDWLKKVSRDYQNFKLVEEQQKKYVELAKFI